jgi:hypothetical protein
MNSIDRPTCVYHALHGTKTVSAHEAELLYKKGWRDSPDPKTLYSGFHGKWYKFILWFRSFKEKESKHWNSVIAIGLFLTLIIGVGTIATMLFTHYDSKQNNNSQIHIENTKE